MTGRRARGGVRSLPAAAAAALLVLAFSAAPAQAAPGDLDPSFSSDGKQTVDFAGKDRATHVVVTPQGRLVVVGATDAIGGGDFAVGRVTAGGSPDSTFGSGGKATFGTDPAVNDVGGGVVVLPDESVVVAGFGGNGQDFVVKGLSAEGVLGETHTFDFGGSETVTAMVAQPDGKLVLVGSTNASGGGAFAILRLNADLTPDFSFDTDGKQTVDFGGGADAANAVAIQPDGKIVVAGQAGNGDMAVTRLNTDGSVDTSFAPASSGKASVDFGGTDVANGVAVQADGKLVLAGTTSAVGAGDVAVARLDAAGALDSGFSGDGKLTLGNALASDSGLALAIQQNGRIVVLAQGDSAAKGDFELFRLAPDGSADTSFGSGGTRAVDFGGAEFDGDVAIQPDGKIVIAGSTDANPAGYDIALARIQGDPVTTGPVGPPPGNPPPGNPPPTVGRIGVGKSAKLPGATRFTGIDALGKAGAKVVDWHWVVTGGGQRLDADCGRSPTLSALLGKAGVYRAKLTVTDSKRVAATAFVSLTIKKLRVKVAGKGVFDCENPAKGNQPDRADCVKTYGFGILQVGSRGATDDCFEIGQSTKDGQKFVEGKIAGPVAINGLYVPVPKSVKTVYDSNGNVSVDGANHLSVKIGPFLTKEFDLKFKINPNKFGVFHLVNVDESANAPKFLGSLPVRGAFSIDLIYHASKTRIGVGLPSPFSFGGKRAAQADAKLIADNVKGLHYDGLSATVPELWLGPIFVSGLNFNYEQSSKSWGGGAKISLPGSRIAIDARGPPTQPPDFGFGIKKGKLDHAGFGVEFQPPTQPDLFPPFHTVLLHHIGAAIGFNPLRLTGRIGITAANIVDEDGVLFGAFATSRQPYTLPEDPGAELAPLAQRTFDRFALAIGGTAKLKVPFLNGDIPLLNSYALYEYPSYFEFGGGFKYGIGPVSIDGNVGGFVYAANRTFNLEGGVRACLRGIKIGYKIFSVKISPCLNVGGVVSSRGLGFCTVLPVPFPVVGSIPVPIGAGYHWGDSFPKIMLFSCDYGPYRQASAFARRAGAGSGGGGASVTLADGLPAAMFRVRGQGAAPDVIVTDPQGHPISESADAVTLQGSEPDTTLVALKRPRAGRWTIAAARARRRSRAWPAPARCRRSGSTPASRAVEAAARCATGSRRRSAARSRSSSAARPPRVCSASREGARAASPSRPGSAAPGGAASSPCSSRTTRRPGTCESPRSPPLGPPDRDARRACASGAAAAGSGSSGAGYLEPSATRCSSSSPTAPRPSASCAARV